MADYENYKIVDAEKLDSALHSLAESIRTKSCVKGDLAFPEPNGFKDAVDIIDPVKKETNPTTIQSNGNHATGGYSHVDVNVQPSSEYIKKTDTNLYTTKFACGIYRPPSETHIANVNITVGFKPKIFYMRMFEGVSTTNTSKRYVVAMIMVLDNNYAHFSGMNDGKTALATGGPVSVYYSSSARSDHSQGTKNRFSATDTGVKGSGTTGSSIYCQAGRGFQWYAWG